MDDNFTYLLSGLLNRHFALGRVARFRQVTRGRQAATYEVLTAQQNEYLIYLYPPTFSTERLTFMASAVNRLDETRFSVMPFLRARTGILVVPGPQGTQMMVGGNPAGSTRLAEEWTEHQLSELGLRMAWMHKAMREELPQAGEEEDLADALEDALALPAEKLPKNQPALDPEAVARLVIALESAATGGAVAYVHGDISVDSMLVDDDQQLRCILDWGLIGPGTPAEDLFWVFCHVCAENVDAFARVAEGYGSLEKVGDAAIDQGVTRAFARRIVEARAGRTMMRKLPERLARREALSEAMRRAFAV